MNPDNSYKFADGHVLEIFHDDDPLNPRHEWDNFGTMVCFHGRYRLGDKDHGYDFESFDELRERIEEDHPGCLILPIYMYDHSGVTINTTGFSCPWDSGQIGFIFASRESIDSEFGDDDKARQCLLSEVETYNQFLTGDIWGFRMMKPCGECGHLEEDDDAGGSCWGFYGSDPIDNGMVEHLAKEYADELRKMVKR